MARSCAWRWASRRSSPRCSRTRPLPRASRPASSRGARHVWRDIDPDRCGHPAVRVRAGLRLRDVRRVGARRPDVLRRARRPRTGRRHGTTFRRFLARRLRGRARDARRLGPPPDHAVPRGPAEAVSSRCAAPTRVPPGLTCALPALWKGLLYDDERCRAAAGARRRLAPPGGARGRARGGGAARARGARVAGRPVPALARELVEHRGGGAARASATAGAEHGRAWLPRAGPAQLALGKSPGEDPARALGRRVEPAPRERLIEYARY